MMPDSDSPTRPPGDSPPARSFDSLPGLGPTRLLSQEILKGEREVLIVHFDEVYRLRVTRNGKLLLTK